MDRLGIRKQVAVPTSAACLAVLACLATAAHTPAQTQMPAFAPGMPMMPGAAYGPPQFSSSYNGYPPGVAPASYPHGPVSPGCDCGAPQQYPAPVLQPGAIDDCPCGPPVGSGMSDMGPCKGGLLGKCGPAMHSKCRSGPPGRVPNAIGDSFGPCGLLMYDNGANNYEIPICLGGGARFKATNNNSAVPSTRFFYNYNHFHNALDVSLDADDFSVNVDNYQLGYEYAFWRGLASFQLNVPVSGTIDSHVQQAAVNSLPLDAELGNVSLAFKVAIYQTYYTTVSTGVGFDFPTGEDFILQDAGGFFVLRNDAYTVSPYLAFLTEFSPKLFVQGFAQTALPVNPNDVEVGLAGGGRDDDSIDEVPLLYLDLSVGRWLYRDGFGNGVAVLTEAHYTKSIGDETEFVFDPGPGSIEISYGEYEVLNVTTGVTAVYGCWDASLAYVHPVLDDQFFDWAAVGQINRRF